MSGVDLRIGDNVLIFCLNSRDAAEDFVAFF